MDKEQTHQAVFGRAVFDKEVLACEPYLKRFARSLVRNSSEADDLVQETFVKAFRFWEKYQPGTNMKAWLATILRNVFYSIKRRARHFAPLDQKMAENVIDPSGDAAKHEESIQEVCALAPIIATLSHEQRDVFIAVKYLGLPYEYLETIFGCSVGTLKSRVHRAGKVLEAGLASGATYSYDLRPWATATTKVPKDHPYYPIAQAYEEIYAFIREGTNQPVRKSNETVLQESDSEEDSWQKLLESGSLDESEDFGRMIRRSN